MHASNTLNTNTAESKNGCYHHLVTDTEIEIQKGGGALEPWPVWWPDGGPQPSFPVCPVSGGQEWGPSRRSRSLPVSKVRVWALCFSRAPLLAMKRMPQDASAGPAGSGVAGGTVSCGDTTGRVCVLLGTGARQL